MIYFLYTQGNRAKESREKMRAKKEDVLKRLNYIEGHLKGIRKMVDDGIKAFNDHDVKALAKTFHPDADFANVIGMTAHGRDQIEAFHKPLLADKQQPGMAWFGKAALKSDGNPAIRFLRPDVATAGMAAPHRLQRLVRLKRREFVHFVHGVRIRSRR